jgi:hypothetical protein
MNIGSQRRGLAGISADQMLCPSPHAADARWFEGVHSASPTDIAYFFPQPNSFFLKEIVLPILLCCRFVLGGRLTPAQRRRGLIVASQAIFCVLYQLAIVRLRDDWSTKREERDQRHSKFHLCLPIA